LWVKTIILAIHRVFAYVLYTHVAGFVSYDVIVVE
jgi:hypothetical protein